jgi:hypothetical protein
MNGKSDVDTISFLQRTRLVLAGCTGVGYLHDDVFMADAELGSGLSVSST